MTVGGGPVVHGYPHLETVRAAITALYKRLSYDTVHAFDTSVAPVDVAFGDQDDLYPGVQRVARAMVRHLRLPDARVIVSFRAMEHAASVELAAGPEYFIELNDRFRTHRRDIGAALAHEVMHVYLHRLDLSFPGTRDNEILTDTAAAYLGAGWLLLDAYREDGASSQKLGYLTPEEFGYVLAKRALAFGEAPETWFTSAQAYTAYTKGLAHARRDEQRPPLTAAGRAGRRRYAKDRRYAREHSAGTPPEAGTRDGTYAFSTDGLGALRVSFPCPTCCQRIRVPARFPKLSASLEQGAPPSRCRPPPPCISTHQTPLTRAERSPPPKYGLIRRTGPSALGLTTSARGGSGRPGGGCGRRRGPRSPVTA